MLCELIPHLHAGVVEGDKGSEQVQVASGEHQGKQDLTLPGNTCQERHIERPL